MIPSTLIGLVLFVALLTPGFIYDLRLDQFESRTELSPFKEILRIITATLFCYVIIFLAFTPVRAFLPHITPSVSLWARMGNSYWQAHELLASSWAAACFAGACICGFIAADPRSRKIATRIQAQVPFNLLTPEIISDTSAWVKLMHFFDSRSEDVFVYVGCQLNDGSYVSGPLYSVNNSVSENADRDLILMAPILLRQAGGVEVFELNGIGFSVVSARNIGRLDYMYFTGVDLFPKATNRTNESGRESKLRTRSGLTSTAPTLNRAGRNTRARRR